MKNVAQLVDHSIMIEWYKKQSRWKRLIFEIVLVTFILLCFEPLANQVGYSVLPWRRW